MTRAVALPQAGFSALGQVAPDLDPFGRVELNFDAIKDVKP
jgi:hypothetical protein